MTETALSQRATPCPRCRYDLNGISAERCPECGLDLAGEINQFGTLPWLYRRRNGRVQTFFKTAWRISFRPRSCDIELERPSHLGDARRFWLVSSLLITLPILALWLWRRMMPFDPLSIIEVPQSIREYWLAFPRETQLAGTWDVFEPLRVGWRMLPVAVVLIFFAIASCLQALPVLLNRRHLPMPKRARAVALGHYYGATMVWWLICMLAIAAGSFILAGPRTARGFAELLTFYMVAGTLFSFAVCIVLTWARAVGAYARATGDTLQSRATAAIAIPVCWIICVAFWLAIVPWLLGVLWTLIWLI